MVATGVMESVNNDRSGSRELIDLDESAKIDLFLDRYQNPETFFQLDNFEYLKTLNSRDRYLAKSVVMPLFVWVSLLPFLFLVIVLCFLKQYTV